MNTARIAGARFGASVRRHRVIAILTVLGVLATSAIVVGTENAAYAASYPSWQDVAKATHSANYRHELVKRIKKLVANLDAKVASTAADAKEKGDAADAAEQLYFEKQASAQSLEKQAKAAAKLSKQSQAQAGQLAAQLARGGGAGGSGNLSLNLFLNASDADNVLDNIGNAGKMSERADGVYKKAIQDKNNAQSLTDQAKIAESITKDAKVKADQAFTIAQSAADTAQTALAESQKHKAELEAQSKAADGNLKYIKKRYLKGVRALYGAGAGLGAGQITSSGWAKPTIGVITAGYGYRNDPAAGGAWRLHTGTDLAAGCNVPIYAAHTGTVVYAGWNGTLGNWILIDDGDGIATGYGHIANGAMLVRQGDRVPVGRNIARTGMTGGATGCHLHFEVRMHGVPVNAVPFMRSKGIVLG